MLAVLSKSSQYRVVVVVVLSSRSCSGIASIVYLLLRFAAVSSDPESRHWPKPRGKKPRPINMLTAGKKPRGKKPPVGAGMLDWLNAKKKEMREASRAERGLPWYKRSRESRQEDKTASREIREMIREARSNVDPGGGNHQNYVVLCYVLT